ncbi:unnamed protein product [Tilletia controversa]|uniref:Protein N-terminal and lysine N-methyltransferase EFM7 n=3 Tax=Tilletia TaxID=13289 RepID=A0A8X7MXC3_9BASI|nr:hypothetical protein CF336_g1996 [Tilletia laevis]KAE8203122.1 hypothetical protein CF328_g1830 [Tilletia controversa]KAE8264075.1 hypothetical protein A4X03_0g1215 [Tilletia caries]KAE8207224.1 hypothetical protein CF335_g1299 [Tilletia laevis]KAE8252666.1 hypothetical protein A4X06_0g2025 [Tilletia controversa]
MSSAATAATSTAGLSRQSGGADAHGTAKADNPTTAKKDIGNEEEDDEEEDGFDIFAEPEAFRPRTPPSTQADWELRIPADGGQEAYTVPISMKLVGHSPLWGHLLWPASQHLSSYLAEPGHRSRFVRSKNVLELGAAAGVPTIACAILGARYVCSTDYPDADLIRTLEGNVGAWSEREVEVGSGGAKREKTGLVETLGYRWGADVGELLEHLGGASAGASYFDTVILSDLIFNHQAHEALLDTCERTTYTPDGWAERWAERRAAVFHSEREDKGLPQTEDGETIYASMPESSERIIGTSELPTNPIPASAVLVSFTHHRPVLAHRDLAFFARARRLGWECAKVGEWACEPVFKDDVGDLKKRSTVHAWALWRV